MEAQMKGYVRATAAAAAAKGQRERKSVINARNAGWGVYTSEKRGGSNAISAWPD